MALPPFPYARRVTEGLNVNDTIAREVQTPPKQPNPHVGRATVHQVKATSARHITGVRMPAEMVAQRRAETARYVGKRRSTATAHGHVRDVVSDVLVALILVLLVALVFGAGWLAARWSAESAPVGRGYAVAGQVDALAAQTPSVQPSQLTVDSEIMVPCSVEDIGVPDYRDGAWHLCGVTVPASAEDTYSVDYRRGAYRLTPTRDL